jgi:hypothetical protein
MSMQRSALGIVVVGLAAGFAPPPVEAQPRLLDRARQAARAIVTEEVMHHADALVGDLATRVVNDGQFMAVATPWLGSDGAGSVDRATLAGAAFAQRSAGGFMLVLCDAVDPQGWRAGFHVQNAAAAQVAGLTAEQVQALREAQRETANRTREAARASGTPPPPAQPFAGSYPLATQYAAASVMQLGAQPGGGAEGTLRIESVSEDLWVGTATLTLPSVRFAGADDPRPVNIVVAFRAQPHTASTPAHCAPGMQRR